VDDRQRGPACKFSQNDFAILNLPIYAALRTNQFIVLFFGNHAATSDAANGVSWRVL
jgi:hypothetical protein